MKRLQRVSGVKRRKKRTSELFLQEYVSLLGFPRETDWKHQGSQLDQRFPSSSVGTEAESRWASRVLCDLDNREIRDFTPHLLGMTLGKS